MMKYVNWASRVILLNTFLFSSLVTGAYAQQQANNLIVMIKGDVASGAGIIFGRDADTIYIATANHNVREGALETRDLQVMLKVLPGKWLSASLMKQSDPDLDLAVISVNGLSKLGIDFCDLPLDRLGDTSVVERGDLVFPVGYPSGTRWGTPVSPDSVSQVEGHQISFQSLFLRKGHSGGGLITDYDRLVGMIVSDADLFGRATNIDSIIEKLQQWGYPIYLQRGGALHKAVEHGAIAEVRTLLARCHGVNDVLAGETPLHVAVRNRRLEVAKLLLAQGANVNEPAKLDKRERFRTNPDWTALHIAANKNFQELVALLLEKGADIDFNKTTASLDEDTPLVVAIKAESFESAKLLVERGAKVKWSTETNFPVPLHMAAERGAAQLVQAMLARGADANQKLRSGETPLSRALDALRSVPRNSLLKRNNLLQTIRILRANGATANDDQRTNAVKSNDAALSQLLRTPGNVSDQELYGAIENGSIGMLESILAQRPELNRENSNRSVLWYEKTPLIFAASLGKVQAVKALLKAGAKVDLAAEGRSPLDWAVAHYRSPNDNPAEALESINVLLTAGADVHSVDFGELVWDRYTKLLEILLAHGADPNKTFKGRTGGVVTPLYVAADHGYVDVVKLLLKSKAIVNLADADGETPLHGAVRRAVARTSSSEPLSAFLEVIEILINAGADVNARNRDGHTPLRYAVIKESQVPEVAALLRSRGAKQDQRPRQ
jgi:ankyrin repeat protein